MSPAQAGPPRWARTLAVPAAGVLLVLFFIVLRFPYERLAAYLSTELSRASGAVVDIGALGPRLRLAGLAVEATGVRATWPDGESVSLDRALLRPAWSFAWFTGTPAFYTELFGPAGEAEGTFTSGGAPGFDGELRRLDLSLLPLEVWWPGAALQGSVNAAIDVQQGPEGPTGPVRFEASGGTIELPGLPLAIPYETLTGDLAFGGEALLTVNALSLAGPLVSADVVGNVGRAASLQAAPLQLEIDLSTEPAVRAALEGMGTRLGRDGRAKLHVTGTAGRPLVR